MVCLSSAEQTGSLGVVTINCARLGYLFRGDRVALLSHLDALMDMARDSLEVKRKVIQHHMDGGLYPYTQRYLGTLRNHFSTIGVNGIHEMLRNFTDDVDGTETEDGRTFAIELLDHIRARLVLFQEQQAIFIIWKRHLPKRVWATYRFAKEDRKRFPDIKQAGTASAPYYTNSSQLPVGFTDDPFLALGTARRTAMSLHRRYSVAFIHGRTH